MSLAIRDKRVIWHPYTQEKSALPIIPIVKGKGAWLYDDRGRKYLDVISSWWVNLHGHAHPYIAKKISDQLKKLEHVLFAGFTHEPAVRLAERLLGHLPENHSKIFFSDNGSTAVEVAVKMVLQYWYNKGITRTKILAFRNGYHGDTFGAMSVSGRSAFTASFNPFLFEVTYIDPPVPGNEEYSLKQLSSLISSPSSPVPRPSSPDTRPFSPYAAFIFEPLVQGAAGMVMHDARVLNVMMKICRKNNILTIADEVMTGFGRTGKFLATDFMQEKPDIVCLSKGLTGGTMAMGATSCTEKIYKEFLSDDHLKTFFHGHSYTANPIACTAALASLDLQEKKKTATAINEIEKRHQAFSKKISGHRTVKNVRTLGTILAIELNTGIKSSYFDPIREKITPYFLKKGILIRPLGNVIYLMPPYCITKSELTKTYDAIAGFLDKNSYL